MYFFRIHNLKTELHSGRLDDQRTFPYILGYMLMWGIGVTVAQWTFPEGSSVLHIAESVIYLTAIVFGTYAAFRANRRGDDTDFAGRYFSLAFVLLIRFAVIVVTASIIIFAALEIGGRGELIDSTWIDPVVTSIVTILFYWRLYVHIGDVACYRPVEDFVATTV